MQYYYKTVVFIDSFYYNSLTALCSFTQTFFISMNLLVCIDIKDHVNCTYFVFAGRQSAEHNYGTIDVLLFKSQSQAKKRIVSFLFVFLVTGLASESFVLIALFT